MTHNQELYSITVDIWNKLGWGFHPDTLMDQYVNMDTERATFNKKQLPIWQAKLERYWELTYLVGVDPYEYGMDVFFAQELTDICK